MPRHSPARRRRILARDDWTCYLCGRSMRFLPRKVRGLDGMGGVIHIDHKTPVCRGGDHSDDNLGATHRLCNQRKGDRTAYEYAQLATDDDDDGATDLAHARFDDRSVWDADCETGL